MEQIPNNSTSNESLIIDLEVAKRDFKDYFLNLMLDEENIDEILDNLRIYKIFENIESEVDIDIKKEISKDISLFNLYLQNELKQKLDFIVSNFSPTVLDDFFDILINTWIEKNQEKVNIHFLLFERIYELFNLCGLNIISEKTLDKLVGALQWNIISPNWLNYNFLLHYFKTLSLKTPKELKNKTWILVELTRIKKQELGSKF